jgi:4-guanidinobutyraldehyde dehydrogenase / NAD-dependent aldehyde dehydrogenase
MSTNLSYEMIKEKASTLRFKGQAFINGAYTEARSGKQFDCINPCTGKSLVTVAACDEVDVDVAVRSARSAFESGSWSCLAPSERKRILLKLADLIEKHQFNLAIMETMDTGKPINETLTIDIPITIKCLRWYAESIDKVYGQVAPTDYHTLALVTREPLGIVGAVTPWNYPLHMACIKVAPALAAGNSVIVKPSEQAPLTTIYFAELASEAGVPDGVFNVVPGLGEVAGRALGLHHDVNAISFTGSTVVGKLFLSYSAQSNMKRIFLECGGKSPNIILSDCIDMDKAALVSAREAFINQGEVCCAPTRLLLQEDIKDIFIEKLLAAGKKYQPADPLHPSTLMGAIIDEAQKDKILSYIDVGKTEGANLALGGRQVHQESGGYFIEPTIFDGVTNTMRIAREEIFGPVLSVISFKTMEEAIHIANDTNYGLAASLWTRDISKAHKMAKALRAGLVSVNCINSGDVTTPFGGYKQSGIGRESAFNGLDQYTEVKTTWIEL